MQTVRQAFTILKQNPLLSTISILGTAFAITMIMAIVITWQTKYADLEPEVNRSRCLYFSAMHVYDKEKDGNNNWSNPSAAFMKECVQPVPEVEYCTAFSPAGLSLASLTDGNNRVKVDAMRTDPDFWKVFSMQFLAGRGFSEADRAGESKAVVVCAFIMQEVHESQRLSMPRDVELRIKIPEGEDKLVITDSVRLKQVVNNLINNAKKFTVTGSITFGYVTNREGYTTIFVEDTGSGISEDAQKHIFERFYKEDSFTQGAGLGLSICQTIVDRLHGSISVSSELGKGTRFEVVIPDANE